MNDKEKPETPFKIAYNKWLQELRAKDPKIIFMKCKCKGWFEYTEQKAQEMITCPYCKNDEKETIHQHDKSLAGYRDYGNLFTCLKCRENFVSRVKDLSQAEIELFTRLRE